MSADHHPEFPLLPHIDIVKNLCIATPIYSGIQRELRRTLAEHATTSTPACKHFVGDSRTGKSFAFREFEAGYPARRADTGLKKEVLYAQAPVNGTIKGLMEALLRALGDPLWMTGTSANLLARLLMLLEQTETKMIILDEFQHLAENGRARLSGATDWLKALVEPNTFSLVCVGLPTSKELIFKSEQLRNRFDKTIEVPVYDWTNKPSRVIFRGLLDAIQASLTPFEMPQLSRPDMALRMFMACGGRIGLLSKLFDRAVKNAIWDNRTAIRLQDLHDAFSMAIWFADDFPIPNGPFFGTFNEVRAAELCATSMKLAAQVPHEEADLETNLGSLGVSKPETKARIRKETARALA